MQIEEPEIGQMTTAAYYNYKKQQFYEAANCEPDTEAAIDEEWYALSNQIRAGKMLHLGNEQIELYADARYDFEKREFIKSCLYEQIAYDMLEKIIEAETPETMRKLKIEYYKSEHILKNLEGTVNTIKSAVGDCETHFDMFERYLETFESQLRLKDEEISALKSEYLKLNEMYTAVQREKEQLNVALTNAQNAGKNRTFVINRIYKDADTMEDEAESERGGTNNRHRTAGSRKLFGITLPSLKKVSDQLDDEITDTPETDVSKTKEKYSKKEVRIENISDFDAYIINSRLNSEQLTEISTAIDKGIDEKYIVSMIENNLSAAQMKSNVNILLARQRAQIKSNANTLLARQRAQNRVAGVEQGNRENRKNASDQNIKKIKMSEMQDDIIDDMLGDADDEDADAYDEIAEMEDDF